LLIFSECRPIDSLSGIEDKRKIILKTKEK
jgi:hypothetical protein